MELSGHYLNAIFEAYAQLEKLISQLYPSSLMRYFLKKRQIDSPMRFDLNKTYILSLANEKPCRLEVEGLDNKENLILVLSRLGSYCPWFRRLCALA